MVLAMLLVATLAGLLKNDLSTPFYKATAKIWVQEASEKGMPFLQDFFMVGLGRGAQLQTYREIILSRTIVAAAVRELRREGRFHPLPVHRGKSVVWLANLLGIQLADKTERGDLTIEAWEKEFIKDLLEDWLKVEPARDADIITIHVRGRTPEYAQDMANKIAAVFQRYIREDMQEQMKQTEKFTAEQRDIIKARLEVAEEGLRAFQVSNQTINLDAEAEMIIENVGQLDIQKTALNQRREGAKARLKSLTDELSGVSQKVISAETLTDNPIVVQLEQKLSEDSIRLRELKHKYPQLDHPEIRRLEAQIRGTKDEIASEDGRRVTSQTTTLNPIHQALTQQIIEVLADIRESEHRLQVLVGQTETYDKLIAEWPEKQVELARLRRKVLLNQELYSRLESTRQEASIVSAAELGSIKIYEKAEVPDRPITPMKKLNLALGMLVGLALGIGLAFLRDYFDNTYPTLEDAQGELEALPEPPSFLGMVPAIEGGSGHRIALVTHDAPKSGPAEAFRILRTKLQFLNSEVPPKTILITSAAPGEGKSIIASNLAVTFAQTNKKVALIDSDMRRPIQHETFRAVQLVHPQQSLPPASTEASTDSIVALESLEASSVDRMQPGLSELLIKINEHGASEALHTVIKKTEVDNLYLVSSGALPPNPAELLNSEAMRKLVACLEEEFDYVVFDSPPICVVADAIILATLVDAVCFVFDIANTRKFDILGGIESLREVTTQGISVLCNLTEPRHGGYYGYGRYGYSRYGYYGRHRYSGYYYDDSNGDEEGNRRTRR